VGCGIERDVIEASGELYNAVEPEVLAAYTSRNFTPRILSGPSSRRCHGQRPVIYYSSTGNVHALAEAIAARQQGRRLAGIATLLRRQAPALAAAR